jgi:hypothetical protein
MPTLAQIEFGALRYDVDGASARYQAKYHKDVGSKEAKAWEAIAEECERIARELRALAE